MGSSYTGRTLKRLINTHSTPEMVAMENRNGDSMCGDEVEGRWGECRGGGEKDEANGCVGVFGVFDYMIKQPIDHTHPTPRAHPHSDWHSRTRH